ncbi:hypothetical protein Tsubulata_050786 [Turnera subulata]|uniref:Cystatin domain-containing protein n=1 Tax=Turnera subulata TaxID=218843 RepID=A0A9Q0G542_9ROSI|nr:hypothetical protein Tsubulata_050786 [Turnera subulata]
MEKLFRPEEEEEEEEEEHLTEGVNPEAEASATSDYESESEWESEPEPDSGSDSDEEAELEQYYKELEETEGYGISRRFNARMREGIAPLDLTDGDLIHLEYLPKCVDHAISLYNQHEDCAARIEFVDFLQVTYALRGGFLYFITFKAKDASGQEKTYQTQVLYQPWEEDPEIKMLVYEFREKPENGKQVKQYNLLPSEDRLRIMMTGAAA